MRSCNEDEIIFLIRERLLMTLTCIMNRLNLGFLIALEKICREKDGKIFNNQFEFKSSNFLNINMTPRTAI